VSDNDATWATTRFMNQAMIAHPFYGGKVESVLVRTTNGAKNGAKEQRAN